MTPKELRNKLNLLVDQMLEIADAMQDYKYLFPVALQFIGNAERIRKLADLLNTGVERELS